MGEALIISPRTLKLPCAYLCGPQTICEIRNTAKLTMGSYIH